MSSEVDFDIFDEMVIPKMGAPDTVKTPQYMRCQTEEHFEQMAREKVAREHKTPLSHTVLVKFGFLKENCFHISQTKFQFQAERIECSDYLLSAV